MSKRRGDVVFLDEFIDEIGVDAARWYLLSRGHDQTIEIDVDLAAEQTARRTRSTTSSTRTPGSRGSSATRGGRGADAGPARGRWRAEERELVKRLLELPGVVREATARRAPHAIPTYAIRVADDFHRFYHEHKVLGSDAAGLPARALHGDADRRRDVPRPASGSRRPSDVSAPTACARSIARCAGISRSAALAASWGFIAVLAAAVDLGAEALAFWRLALAAATLALVALATRRLDRSRPGGRLGALAPLGRRAGRPLAALLRGRRARLGRARRAHLLRGAAPHRACCAPFVLGERLSSVRRARRLPRRRGSGSPRSRSTAAGDGAVSAAAVAARARLGRDVRRARAALEAAPARSAIPPLTVAFWDCLVGALAVAPALLLADRVLPDGAGEWGAVLAARRRLHRDLDARSTRCSCATSPRRQPVCSRSSSRSPACSCLGALEQPPGTATLVGAHSSSPPASRSWCSSQPKRVSADAPAG